MSVITLTCYTAARKGARIYPPVLMRDLLKISKKSKRKIIGNIGSLATAGGYIENTIQLDLLERKGGYLRTTTTGKAAAIFSQNKIRANISLEEKALYLSILLTKDLPCLLALIDFISGNPSSFQTIVREITYPGFTRFSHSTRQHRIRPRLQWITDIGLVKKVNNIFHLIERDHAKLIGSLKNPWQIVYSLLGCVEKQEFNFTEFFFWAYQNLRMLNRLNSFVDLKSIFLLYQISRTLKGLECSSENFIYQHERFSEKHKGNLSFYSPIKENHETLSIKGKPSRYVIFSHNISR